MAGRLTERCEGMSSTFVRLLLVVVLAMSGVTPMAAPASASPADCHDGMTCCARDTEPAPAECPDREADCAARAGCPWRCADASTIAVRAVGPGADASAGPALLDTRPPRLLEVDLPLRPPRTTPLA